MQNISHEKEEKKLLKILLHLSITNCYVALKKSFWKFLFSLKIMAKYTISKGLSDTAS